MSTPMIDIDILQYLITEVPSLASRIRQNRATDDLKEPLALFRLKPEGQMNMHRCTTLQYSYYLVIDVRSTDDPAMEQQCRSTIIPEIDCAMEKLCGSSLGSVTITGCCAIKPWEVIHPPKLEKIAFQRIYFVTHSS